LKIAATGESARSEGAAWRAAIALVLIVPVPTLGAFAGLVYPKGAFGQGLYAAAKIWIVLFPLFWLLAVERGRLSWSPPHRGGLGAGALLGAAIAVVIFAGYYFIARPLIDAESVKALAAERGLADKALFIPMALYWVLVNSLIEEYVWRWFVFTRCRRAAARIGAAGWLAVAASALFFTAHHVVAMRALFGWGVTALACSGVFVGGAAWSWLYARYESIWPAYASHLVADIPIFLIGWHLIFGGP